MEGFGCSSTNDAFNLDKLETSIVTLFYSVSDLFGHFQSRQARNLYCNLARALVGQPAKNRFQSRPARNLYCNPLDLIIGIIDVDLSI